MFPRFVHFCTKLPISIWSSYFLKLTYCEQTSTDARPSKWKICTQLFIGKNVYSYPGRPALALCFLDDRWGFQPDFHLNKSTVIKRSWLKKLHKLEQTAVIWKEQMLCVLLLLFCLVLNDQLLACCQRCLHWILWTKIFLQLLKIHMKRSLPPAPNCDGC